MKMIALGFLSLHRMACFGQHTTHAWLLSQFRVDFNKQVHTLELGHRRQENFLNNHSQSLFRYTFSYQVNSKRTGFGGGIAEFIHARNTGKHFEMEVRPFIQVIQQFPLKAIQLQLRFRNEFRFFDGSTKDQDRMRFQVQLSHILIADFNTRLLYFNEWFYSFGSARPWEWRGGISIQQPVAKNWKIGIGYIYQNRENSVIRNVHIIQLSGLYEFLSNQ